MRENRSAGTGLESRLVSLAWKATLGFTLAMPALLLGFALLIVIQTPKAASAQLMPNWRLSWDSLAQDDVCPTPPAGTYCDATLARRRLCVGPLEVRYSFVH
jgi:hypothetical protein